MTDRPIVEDNISQSQHSAGREVTTPEEKKDGDDSTLRAREQDKDTKDDKEQKKEETKTLPKKYTDWPVRNIKEPHDNDVLYGRGGGTNHHPGNKRYRKMVEDRKIDYVNRKRLDKPLVALDIIREWRGQDPPGRFLKLDEKTGLWFDVGDKKAREKTSQALREKAPEIRKKQEEERSGHDKGERGDSDDDDDDSDEGPKSTRFADGTNLEGKDPLKPVLARDHSLGREYLEPNEAMTLEGFSWREPLVAEGGNSSEFLRANSGRISSSGSYGSMPSMPPPGYLPASRVGSLSSLPPLTVPPGGDAYRYPSYGSMGPPSIPHPGSYEQTTSGDPLSRYSSWGRYESWSSAPDGPPPPTSSGYSYPPPPSWIREHSFSQNPLPHATVNQPAYRAAFESRSGSGTWGPPPGHYYPAPPEGPPPHYQSILPPPEGHYQSRQPPPPPENITSHYDSSRQSPPPPAHYSQTPPAHYGPPIGRDYSGVSVRSLEHPKSPSYSVNLAVASQWSGQDPSELAKSLSGGSDEQDKFSTSQMPSFNATSKMPKPDIVKRATSNQNETIETKPDLRGPSVKRAALNRDSSAAANRLKEQYLPGYFDSEKEVKLLSENLEQSTIATDNDVKPVPLSKTDRSFTAENIAMDVLARPVNIGTPGRSTTVDVQLLDIEDDESFYKAVHLDSPAMDEVVADIRQGAPRPSAITAASRLTTTDVFALVNEPIEEDDPIYDDEFVSQQ